LAHIKLDFGFYAGEAAIAAKTHIAKDGNFLPHHTEFLAADARELFSTERVF
jgi:hypothetical protein